MLIEAIDQVERAVEVMLSVANRGAAGASDFRLGLRRSKGIASKLSAFQTAAAACVAATERHGDGGAQILADTAGLTRSDARGRVRTARVIDEAPAVREALDDGRLSMANAKHLAEAVRKTSAGDVEADADLLARAESMRPEDFGREAKRWTADRQSDGGEADYRRLRAKRSLRMWDGKDGMVHLRAEFDPVTGRRVRNRLRAEAKHLYAAAKAAVEAAAESGDADVEKPSWDASMLDALDRFSDEGGAITSTGSSGSEGDGGGGKSSGSGGGKASNDGGRKASGSRALADVTVIAHIDDATGELLAEIAGGDPLPQPVFDMICCNARLKGAVFGTKGTLLWQGRSKRTRTETQFGALRDRSDGCFHCRAPADKCQAHHIEPVRVGGPTNVDNMVLICWTCHQRIHYDGWQIHTRGGQHRLHPPSRESFGPARAPEQHRLQVQGTPDTVPDPPRRRTRKPSGRDPGAQPGDRARPEPDPTPPRAPDRQPDPDTPNPGHACSHADTEADRSGPRCCCSCRAEHACPPRDRGSSGSSAECRCACRAGHACSHADTEADRSGPRCCCSCRADHACPPGDRGSSGSGAECRCSCRAGHACSHADTDAEALMRAPFGPPNPGHACAHADIPEAEISCGAGARPNPEHACPHADTAPVMTGPDRRPDPNLEHAPAAHDDTAAPSGAGGAAATRALDGIAPPGGAGSPDDTLPLDGAGSSKDGSASSAGLELVRGNANPALGLSKDGSASSAGSGPRVPRGPAAARAVPLNGGAGPRGRRVGRAGPPP